ncbi:MAG: agmatine deiminase family protein [Bacteroidales bacterium]|nr:agmatine deiminase family protein [Bacteroidales bacterium]
MQDTSLNIKPVQEGYFFPAEWHKHESTWLSYPHNENSWPGKIDSIFPYYNKFIKHLSEDEKVHINVLNNDMLSRVECQLKAIGTDMAKIHFHLFETNDAWIRDHGPAFVINNKEKALVNWEYNAWGGKYPSDKDNLIPHKIAEYLGVKEFSADIVMEGGSVDFNGLGDVITTESCLLNENRNPQLTQSAIEQRLHDYYRVNNIIWLKEGVEGDDTDGHIDDLTRFVNEDTVITMVCEDKNSEDYNVLNRNLDILKKSRLLNGKQLNIIEMLMPQDVIYEDQKLPASYANFYIANNKVIVPLYQCKNDDKAMQIFEEVFKDRKIIGIDSTDIVWGLGSFHCLSQQEPALM